MLAVTPGPHAKFLLPDPVHGERSPPVVVAFSQSHLYSRPKTTRSNFWFILTPPLRGCRGGHLRASTISEYHDVIHRYLNDLDPLGDESWRVDTGYYENRDPSGSHDKTPEVCGLSEERKFLPANAACGVRRAPVILYDSPSESLMSFPPAAYSLRPPANKPAQNLCDTPSPNTDIGSNEPQSASPTPFVDRHCGNIPPSRWHSPQLAGTPNDTKTVECGRCPRAFGDAQQLE